MGTINKPSADLLDLPSTSAPAALGNAAVAGTSNLPSASDHVHQIPALTGDVTKEAGTANTIVAKLRGNIITTDAPSKGNVLTWNGLQLIWSTPSVGGGTSGSAGGVTFYLNYGVNADTNTGLPALVPNTVVYKELGRAYSTGAASITSGAIPNTSAYVNICGFVTDVLDPDTLVIPMGLWDFNIWASTTDTTSVTNLRVQVIKLTAAGASSVVGTSNSSALSTTATQLTLVASVEQQTWNTDDRLAIILQSSSSVSGSTVTVRFGNGNPSHCHTTVPTVGGSGLVRVTDGVIQSQGSTISDSDVASNAAIAVSKINGAVASSTLGQTNGVAQLGSDGKLKSTQVPALTTDQLSGITASSLGAIPSTDAVLTATAGKVVKLNGSGAISSEQLATISDLPTGPIGSYTGIPVITVDNKGRVTSLTTTSNSGINAVVAAVSTTNISAESKFSISILNTTVGSKNVTCVAPNNNGVLAAGQVFTGAAGIGTTVIESVASQISFTVAKAATQTATYNSVQVLNSTLTRLTVAPLQTIDGHTLSIGEIVLLTAQTVPAQNGPWVYTSLITLDRPDWWSGVLQFPIIFDVIYGDTNANTQWKALATSAFSQKRANLEDVSVSKTGDQAFTDLTLPASTSAASKLKFGSGGVLSEVRANNALDWDGKTLYLTPDSSASRKRVAYQEGTINAVASAPPEIFTFTGVPVVGSTSILNRITNSVKATTFFQLGMFVTGGNSGAKSYVNKIVAGQYVEFSTAFTSSSSSTCTVLPTYSLDNDEIIYFSSDTTSDFILSFGGSWTNSSPRTVNDSMDVGSVKNITVIVNNGVTARKLSSLYIDGVTQTIKWAGGAAPSVGNSSSSDAYTFTIMKTASSTFLVLGALVKYKS